MPEGLGCFGTKINMFELPAKVKLILPGMKGQAFFKTGKAATATKRQHKAAMLPAASAGKELTAKLDRSCNPVSQLSSCV
jgi:hypothetical protein